MGGARGLEDVMARISLTPRKTLLLRIMSWYARRKFGRDLEPMLATGHNPKVLRSVMRFQMGVERWKALDASLTQLAMLASAARIGCSWCVDFGYWHADQLGLSMEKVSKVPAWREHREAFTPVELLVMEYAEQMSETEPTVSDAVTEALQDHLGEAAFVELTAVIALENFFSRTNSALGMTSQGFSESCAIQPVAVASEK
jgi:AhpD family alkylhydroperoxidase